MKKTAVLAIIFGLLLVSFPVRSSSMNVFDRALTPHAEIIAHRGFMDLYPENTLPAFVNSLAQGAKAVELDVQITKDGVPVVIHDDSVDRTTNGRGRVSALTLAQVSSLDSGIRFNKSFQGTAIPTLHQVLAAVNRKGIVYVELKSSVKPQFVPKVLRDIYDTNMGQYVFITSFYQDILLQVRKSDPKIPLVVLYGNDGINFKGLEKLHPAMLSIEYRRLLKNPQLVKAIREHGMDLSAWTVNDPQDVVRLERIGVYKVLSNHPFPADSITNL